MEIEKDIKEMGTFTKNDTIKKCYLDKLLLFDPGLNLQLLLLNKYVIR